MLLHVNGHVAPDLRFKRHHDELREYWQAKLLLIAKGKMFAVACSVIAHNFPNADSLEALMQVCFPGFIAINPPFYSSAARIMKGGEIAADLIERDGTRVRHALVFQDKTEMESAWRRLCDEARLSDADRVAAFDALKRWVVADFGLDPSRPAEVA